MALTRDSFTEGRLRQRLGADPPRLTPTGYDLAGANLARLGLSKAQLDGSRLLGANLRGADLQRASLVGACLAQADLSGALLQDANLTRADLNGANLTRAVLDATLLDGATLSGARLTGAEVRNVALWRAGLAPDEVIEAVISLAGLFAPEVDPDPNDVPHLLHWVARVGMADERWAMRRCLSDRRWRPWRDGLRQAMGAIDARVGPLTNASLSPARPAQASDASLSQADDPHGKPTEHSLSWLREWRERRQGPTGEDD